MNPKNDRGISLLSCFGKFFTAILNQRLLVFVIENNILSNAQLCFIPGNRTSDALIILFNLINYYVPREVNLYTEDKACIKVGNQISNFFSRTQGVKQGCILSPLLFNICLSGFQKDIEKEENDPVEITPGDTLGRRYTTFSKIGSWVIKHD